MGVLELGEPAAAQIGSCVSAEMELARLPHVQVSPVQKTGTKKTGAEAPVLRAVLIDQRCEYM